jgi:hypothetical protein
MAGGGFIAVAAGAAAAIGIVTALVDGPKGFEATPVGTRRGAAGVAGPAS